MTSVGGCKWPCEESKPKFLMLSIHKGMVRGPWTTPWRPIISLPLRSCAAGLRFLEEPLNQALLLVCVTEKSCEGLGPVPDTVLLLAMHCQVQWRTPDSCCHPVCMVPPTSVGEWVLLSGHFTTYHDFSYSISAYTLTAKGIHASVLSRLLGWPVPEATTSSRTGINSVWKTHYWP